MLSRFALFPFSLQTAITFFAYAHFISFLDRSMAIQHFKYGKVHLSIKNFGRQAEITLSQLCTLIFPLVSQPHGRKW